MYQKIQQTFKDNQQALQKKSNELMEPIVTKVRNAISAVGKAGAYTYILEEGSALYMGDAVKDVTADVKAQLAKMRSEEHTSELQSRQYLVCRLLLEKKKKPPQQRAPCTN